MAIYRTGKASMDASGNVTGTGTKWKSALTLIRAGATILFMADDGLHIAVIANVISDTEIRAITTDGQAVASSDYAILLHDSITVDGLAQDVAETLRYYQGKESEIARFVDIVDDFDWDKLEQIRAETKASEENAAASATASADSATASATAQAAAETARDETTAIKDQAVADVGALKSEAQQAVTDAQAAQAASEAAQAGSESARDSAAQSAAEAEDYAKQLNADELMRKDANLSDVEDKALALKNLQDGKPLTLVSDAIGQYDAVTLKQLQAASGGGGGADMNGVMNNFIGCVEWFAGSRALLPPGYIAADGQLESRTDPKTADLWAAVKSGMLVSTATDAIWVTASSGYPANMNRGMYSPGDGSTTFRVPDLNGIQSGSVKAPFLRGSAATDIVGRVSQDSAPNINGTITLHAGAEPNIINTISGVGSSLAPSNVTANGYRTTSDLTAKTGAASAGGIVLDASKSSDSYGRDGSGEVHPSSVNGIWIIRASGAFEAAGTNFNVINSEETLPANGTLVRGGALRSVYEADGKTQAAASLQVKANVGGSVVPEISTENSAGAVTSWTLPVGGGEVITNNQVQSSVLDTNTEKVMKVGGFGFGGTGQRVAVGASLTAILYGGVSQIYRNDLDTAYGFKYSPSLVMSTLDTWANICVGYQGAGIRVSSGNQSGAAETVYNLYTDKNTTRASDGTLKAASPIARIVKSREDCDRVDINEADFEWCGAGTCNGEARGITISRTGVGIYVITGALGLAKEGWRIAPPRDPNGEGDLGVVVGQENESEGTITVLLYKKKYALSEDGDLEVVKGPLIDVPAHSWIDVRLEMPKVEESLPGSAQVE